MVLLRSLGYGQHTTEGKILDECEAMVEEMRKTNQKDFDPLDVIHLTVTNIICNLLFNERYNHDDVEFKSFLQVLKKYILDSFGNQLLDSFLIFKYLPWGKTTMRRIRSNADIMNSFVKDKIDKQRKDFENNKSVNDFIQVRVIQTI